MVTIRRAVDSDIDTVQMFGSKLLDFERENYDSSLDKNWAFSDEAKEKYLVAIREKYVAIAEADNQPIGFLIGNIIPPRPGDARQIKQAYIQNIYVEEKQRSTGVGRKLIEEFKSYCEKESVNRLNVSVLATNKVANDFYKRVGFNPRSINLYLDLNH